MPDHALSVHQSREAPNEKHRRAAKHHSGIGVGSFEHRGEDGISEFVPPETSGIKSSRDGAGGRPGHMPWMDTRFIKPAEETAVGIHPQEGGAEG